MAYCVTSSFVLAGHKKIFIDGATKRKFDAKKAAELFDLMAYFAGYGFNKSHSTAYALIAYHTAYLKANYPKEFLAAVLSFETNDPDKLTFYLQEISHMGLKTISPNINRSEIEFSAQEDGILFGLQGIKNVGLAALQNIIAEREQTGHDLTKPNHESDTPDQEAKPIGPREPKPFVDLLDFCKRVDLRTVNKRVVESLIAAGAMDDFPGNRAQKTHELDKIITLANTEKEAAKTGQMQLFNIFGASTSGETKQVEQRYAFQARDEWSDKEKLAKEKEIVGFYLSSHPLETHKALLDLLSYESFESAYKKLHGKSGFASFSARQEPVVVCCGLKQSHREITTKKGDRMAFAQFEDFSGTCEVVIFPRVFQKIEQWIDEYNVFIIKGTLDTGSDQKCKIKANNIIPVELFFEEWPKFESCTLELPSGFEQETLDSLGQTLKAGKTVLNFSFYENGKKLLLRSRKNIRLNKGYVETLQAMNIGIKIGL